MAQIHHGSAHADDPKRAAENLAAIVGGTVAPFQPLPGGWACLFDGSWNGAFLELYPKTHGITANDEGPGFAELAAAPAGVGTHFNISVEKMRSEVEAICRERGLRFSWRDWAGFLDIWIDDSLLVEIVCKR